MIEILVSNGYNDLIVILLPPVIYYNLPPKVTNTMKSYKY